MILFLFIVIPAFPKFKKLELSDIEYIQKHNSNYPPYSDFNFVSMWSWNTKNEMLISILHENLVVRFANYLTGEPFYSFLGNNKVNETTKALLDLSLSEGIDPRLHLMPDTVTALIDHDKFNAEEDRDNFDYVYDINLISEYSGATFSDKRNKVGSFLKNFPNVDIKVLDLKDPLIQKSILQLNEEWLKDKVEKDIDFQIHDELLAIQNFFRVETIDIVGIGVFIEEKFVGYSIFEKLSNRYSICHFCKVDNSFKSIHDYLMRESARVLRDLGYSFLNYEQDLGLPGLRYRKTSFRPKYFRKFKVSFCT